MSSTNGAIPKRTSGRVVTSSPCRTRISEEPQFSDISVMHGDGSGAPPLKKRGRPKITHDSGPSTSTPQQHRMRSKLTLPSAPAVEELQAAVDHHRTLSEFFSRLNVSEPDLDRSTSTGGEDQHIRRRRRVADKGQDYVHFKPKHSGRLYDALVKVDPDVDEEVNRWLSLYQENADEAILVLIRFMVDICGLQDVDIERVFSNDEMNFMELKDFLQENMPPLQEESGQYLFRGNTLWGKRMQEVILAFFRRLFLIAFESDTLFDLDILLNFAGVVTMLITSSKRSMHHTGMVIGAKTITTFMEIVFKIENKIEKCRARPKTEQLERQVEALKSSKQELLTIIEKLHQMVEKRCYGHDGSLGKMKVAILEEMFKWFTLDPSLLINTKYLSRISAFLTDDKLVRFAALQVCQSLVNSDELYEVLTPYRDRFVMDIMGRVLDKDCDTATLAVEICTDLLNKNEDVIPEGPYCNKVLTLVYCKDTKLAIAAGKFVIDVLSKHYNGSGTAVELLKKLIQFSQVQPVVDYVALLVEAVFPHFPLLQDWNTMVNLILSNKLERNDAVRLLDILSCAAYQVLTGNPKVPRDNTMTCKFVKAHELRRTSHVLLNAVPGLIDWFEDDAHCIHNIIEIFLNLNYKDASLRKFKNIIINVVNKLQEIFNTTTHTLLLDPITNAFSDMTTSEFPFSDKVISSVNNLKLNIVRDLSHCLEHAQQLPECDDTQLSRIEEKTARLAALFTYFDVTELLDVVAFDMFLNDIDFLKSYNVTNILKIYYWYIIWTFRRVIETVANNDMENFTEKVDFLKKTTNRFLKFCYEFMQNLSELLVANNAFGYATEIYLFFHNELEKTLKLNEQLSELVLKIDEERCRILTDVAENLFFYERGLTKKERCKYLQNFISMAFLRVIPFQELSLVYKYYYECFTEYARIFEEGLNKLRENSSVCLVGVILQTLNHCYTTFNLNHKEEKDNLRMLAKQFQIFISNSIEERMLLLKLGIKYAVFSEARLPILYFLKYFTLSLPAKEKREIEAYLTSKLPEAQVKYPQVEDFICYLNSSIRPARLVRAKPVTRSSTKSSELSIDDATTTLNSTVPESDQYTIEDESEMESS